MTQHRKAYVEKVGLAARPVKVTVVRKGWDGETSPPVELDPETLFLTEPEAQRLLTALRKFFRANQDLPPAECQ